MQYTEKTPHESAVLHVTGKALYVDDIPVPADCLHGFVVTSPHASARIASFSLEAARNFPGVAAVICHQDIPGHNDMGPVVHDEQVLAEGEVKFIGQAVFLIAAVNEETARLAAAKIQVEYEPLEAILTLRDAIAKGKLMHPARKIECGDVDAAFRDAPYSIEGELETGAQEHWYLETHACLCIPGEGDEIHAFSSTQHPSETQGLIAEVLDIPRHSVTVTVRRMGGGFGGKETQANHVAIWSALLSRATGKPVKIRLFRDDDQKMTGKRHPYLIRYRTAFDSNGRILAHDTELNADAGSSTDLTMAILERAMFHTDNAYFIPHCRIVGKAWFTNLPSNTAFRGFGGPQGMAGIEHVIDRIARKLGKDPAEVRKLNFYQQDTNDTAPYGQVVRNNLIHIIWDRLLRESNYTERRSEIASFNANSRFIRRGIAATPVKFGISFTTSFLNQAGALLNIYRDGTALVNHGGTEMGQGLHTKIRQIAAHELGMLLDEVRVNATDTSKVPNTSATAASTGTDLNGMAVKHAADEIKRRLLPLACEKLIQRIGSAENMQQEHDVSFSSGRIFFSHHPETYLTWAELAEAAVLRQISLSATGYYRTPGLHFNRETGKGNPFHYYAWGAAVSEVELDTLTGHVKHLRTDILHDTGNSLNTGIDRGQIEGGYIQGLGWVTTEVCKRDAKGNLLNHSPDTYKIPGIRDIPQDFRVSILEGYPNDNTIGFSKAVGEPPFMLALSTWLAIKDAISAEGEHRWEPDFSLPASDEVILLSLEEIRKKKKSLQA